MGSGGTALGGNWDAVILELLTKRCVPGLNGRDREKQALKAGGVSGKIPLRVSHLSYFSFFMALNVPAAGNCRGRGFLEKPGSVWGQYLSPPFPRLRTICAFAACAGDKRRAPCLQRLVGITGITVPFLWLPRYDQVSENPLGAAPPEPCKHHSLLSRATVIKDK